MIITTTEASTLLRLGPKTKNGSIAEKNRLQNEIVEKESSKELIINSIQFITLHLTDKFH